MENKNIKHAGSAATEHAQEINEKVQFEVNKNIAMNPIFPLGDRAQGAVDAVGNKVSEKTHEVKKAYHQNQAGLMSDVVTGQGQRDYSSTTGYGSIYHAGSAASEHAQEINQKAQFDVNKNIAMNPNLPMGDRAQGAVDAVGNKMSEKTHEVKKAYHQNQAGLMSDVVTGQGQRDYSSTTGYGSIYHAGSAATEHAQEINQKAQFDVNKNIAMNPNLPMGYRAQGAVDAVGNKVSETAHEVKKAYHQTQAGLMSDVVTGQGQKDYSSTTGYGTIHHAGSAAIEHAQEIDQKVQFDVNKNIAMNPNLPMGERAQGAVGAAGNLMSEKAHEVKKAYHQTQAGLMSDVVTGQGLKGESNIKHAGSAAIEHAQEIDQKAQFELNKNIAMNPNLPMGDRTLGAVDAFGNLISEKTHEVKKAYHQNQAGLMSDVVTGQGLKEYPTGESSIKHAGSAAIEHAQEIDQKAQFEVNKNIAVNPNLPMGERALGAVDAFGNKISEKTHEVKKAYHQTQAGLMSDVVTGQGLREYPSSVVSTGIYEHKFTPVDSNIKHAGIAAQEHSKEIDQKQQYEFHKDIAMNPNVPLSERAQGAVGAAGNLMSEKAHEASKVLHQGLSGLTPNINTPFPTTQEHKVDIKQAGIAALEHSYEIDQKARFEANKNVVMNPDIPVGERAEAAIEAVANLMNEKVHEVNKAYHQTLSGVAPEVLTAEGHREQNPTIKHAGIAATEHSLEMDQKAQYELHKNVALNTNLPVGDRAQAAVEAVGNLISEKAHETNKAYHQTQAGLTDIKSGEGQHELISTTSDKIKHAGIAATEHALELNQKQQFELNKDIAMNEELNLGERTQAAVGAVGNKIGELSHEVSKKYHQNLAGVSADVKTAYAPRSFGLTYDSETQEKPVPKRDIKQAGWAAKEHAIEIDQKTQYNENINIALNSNIPIPDRAQAAVDALGNKISEKTHEVSKVYFQTLSGLGTDDHTPIPEKPEIIEVDKIKHAGIAAIEHSQEINQKAEFEVNKNLALNPELPLTDRAQAALVAVGNKISAVTHETSKSYHQSLAGVSPVVITSDLPIAAEIQDQKSHTLDKLQHISKAATEHSQEVDQKEQFELNKNLATDPSLPASERTTAALGALGNKLSEKLHKSNKIYHRNLAGLKNDMDQEEQKPSISGKIVHAGIAATEHAAEIDQKEQFEVNKNIAANPDIPVVDRTQAAIEAVGNKISEKAHEATKVYHQKINELVE